MKRILLLASVALIGMQPAANAAGTWKTRAFEANYSYSMPQKTGDYRMASDGKGKALMQTNLNDGTKSTILIDFTKNEMYSITTVPGGQQMAMKMPYKDQSNGNTADEMKKLNAQNLGNKVVAGHPAHGYSYNTSGTAVETWIADDIDFCVQSQTKNPQTGATNMVLKSYKAAAPAAEAFKLPSGVKVMDMSHFQPGKQ